MQRSEINKNSVIQWSPDAVATEVNDEIVLMHLERNRCYGLGETGSEIWRRLASPIPVSDLLSQLAASYDAPAGQIESDVVRVLNDFADEGLIEVSATAGRSL